MTVLLGSTLQTANNPAREFRFARIAPGKHPATTLTALTEHREVKVTRECPATAHGSGAARAPAVSLPRPVPLTKSQRPQQFPQLPARPRALIIVSILQSPSRLGCGSETHAPRRPRRRRAPRHGAAPPRPGRLLVSDRPLRLVRVVIRVGAGLGSRESAAVFTRRSRDSDQARNSVSTTLTRRTTARRTTARSRGGHGPS